MGVLSRAVAWCAGACLVLGWVSCAHGQGGPPPALVVVDDVRLDDVAQVREVTGEIRAVRRSTIASEREGLVLTLGVEAGDHVDAGQEIARLKDVTVALEVERAEATVRARTAVIAQRTAEMEQAQLDLDRLEAMLRDGGAQPHEVETARTDLRGATAQLDEANASHATAVAELALARELLSQMTLRAPFGGTVLSKRTEVGQWIGSGDPVIELVDTDTVEAWIDVPESLVRPLKRAGAEVVIEVESAGFERRLPVTAVIPVADAISRLFPVRVRLGNRDGELSAGMSATGRVPTGGSDRALTVHRDGVRRDDAGAFVFVAQGDDELRARPVRIRVQGTSGDRVVVSGELRAGWRVVIEGNERLFPGQPLEILPSGSGADRAGGGSEAPVDRDSE